MRLIKRSLVIGLLVCLGVFSAFAQNKIEADFHSNHIKITKDVLNLRTLPLLGDMDSANWILLATIRPSFGENEIFIGLASFSSDSARLVVQRPGTLSVYRQLEAYPNLNYAEANNISRIKLISKIIDSDKCRGLLSLVARWEAVSIGVVPKNELRMDAVGYDLEFRGRYGSRLIANFEGGKLIDDMSPIIRLLAETSRICG